MMFRSPSEPPSSVRKIGFGGRSNVNTMNRLTCVLISPASSKRSRSDASALAVMACDSSFNRPWKTCWIIEDCGFVLLPPRERWRLLRNQWIKSTGSDCCRSVNFFDERSEISCSSSCGET